MATLQEALGGYLSAQQSKENERMAVLRAFTLGIKGCLAEMTSLEGDKSILAGELASLRRKAKEYNFTAEEVVEVLAEEAGINLNIRLLDKPEESESIHDEVEEMFSRLNTEDPDQAPKLKLVIYDPWWRPRNPETGRFMKMKKKRV